ncbi:serine/threonine protein kinase [Oscillochloris trichoides DG-6]|uniref:non-specific serine/threonine protein kinase n=1 Tax=Oscillochloris trichoides DG-6 TaxID=765420 RepID=E1ICQ6_9CHLR|nr:serine/threonine-protein kinase [Oscillochloris trichoides]EFO81004.1 serine/threonine protein kinase [Oscillochloris trichoides DG-6]
MLKSLINQRLGRYEITALLGRGGMAAVYRATDTILQRAVALKVLYPQYSDDATLIERFTREAVIAASLEHPHIVPVYDVGEQDGMAYMAMKLLDGETLQERLQREGTLSPTELCTLLQPVAAALDYAHSRGVIHRDIKPGNIFLCQTPAGPPQVMLTDFGIAKRLDAPGLTTTGSLLGTPDYMAPEQIGARPVDARTDVYALGMLAFRALTGRRAFEGTTQDVLLAHLYQMPPLPSSVAPGLPPACDPIILRAVATDPANRFPSASSFVAALAALDVGVATAVGVAPLVQTASAAHSAPTRRPPVVPVITPAATPPPQTHTTMTQMPAERRPSNLPWIIAIILALVAGGAAVGMGMLIGRSTSGLPSSVALLDTPTPTLSAVPTPVPTLAPSPTMTLTPEVAVVAVSPSPSPTPSATPIPAKPPTLAPVVVVVTVIPSLTPVPPTATAMPTATATPTASATPTPTVDCTEGMLQGGFGRLYHENVSIRERLGCPLVPERGGHAAIQFFERGTMFYWGLNPTNLKDTIVIFYGLNSGDYSLVDPREAASYPDVTPEPTPNYPVRGFGRVYFGKAGVAEALGNWRSGEIELKEATQGVIQFFEGGIMIFTPVYQQPGAGNRAIFVLYTEEVFERYNDP